MPSLAPCLAVVGPANSGKTTLLHLLDRALQHHPSQPLAYVVKGTPDGTGRYLFHAPELDRLVAEEGGVVLGGAAPAWAYATALHRALDRDPETRVQIFDPKAAGGLVEIPRRLGADPLSPLARALHVAWETAGGDAMLRLAITTGDKMLPPMAFQLLPSAPVPTEPVPDGALWTSGAGPIWLHLAYSRWLRDRGGGRNIGLWDARTRGIVLVTGPDAPRFEPRELPQTAPTARG